MQVICKNTFVFFCSDNGGYLNYRGGFENISSNGVLRGQKTQVYEGGHRVPAIAWWPDRIKPGVSHHTAATFDLFPTLTALAKAEEPADVAAGAAARVLVPQVDALVAAAEAAAVAARRAGGRAHL